MAIPFRMPYSEEDPQSNWDILSFEFSDMWRRFQNLSHSNESNNQIPRLPRVCCDGSCVRRTRRVSRVVSAPEDAPLLAQPILSPTIELGLGPSPPPVDTSTNSRAFDDYFMTRQRLPGGRTCCLNSRVVLPTFPVPRHRRCGQGTTNDGITIRKAFFHPDCNILPEDQIGEVEGCSEKPSPNSGDKEIGLITKLLPMAFTSSIWTAVICVVGWHLLRAR